MLVERNSSEICPPRPYLYPSASPFLPPVWAQPLSPSQIPQGEPAVPRSFRGKEQPATHSAAFSFLFSSSLDLVWGELLLPGVPRHADIREPNPQERGPAAANGPVSAPEAAFLSF